MARRQASKSETQFWFGMQILGVVLLVGIVILVGMLYFSGEKRKREAATKARETARAAVTNAYQEIAMILERTEPMAAEAGELLPPTRADLKFVLGRDDIQAPGGALVQSGGTATAPRTVTPKTTPAATQTTPKTTPAVRANGLPAGILSPEELRRRHEREKQGKRMVPKEMSMRPGLRPKQPKAPPKPSAHPMLKAAQTVADLVHAIEKNHDFVKSQLKEGKSAHDRALVGSTAKVVYAEAEPLFAAVRATKDVEKEVARDLEAAKKARERVIAYRTKHEEKLAEAARKAEEKRKAEELKARTESEVAGADPAYEIVKPLLAERKYTEALDTMKQAVAGLTTDGGRAAYAVYLDRIPYLIMLEKYMIDNINKNKFVFGWGAGETARDIVGASQEGIVLLGGRKVAWLEVDQGHLERLFDHYVVEAKDTMDTNRYTDLLIAIGIYYYVSGSQGESSKWLSMAKSRSDKHAKEVRRMKLD